MIEAMEDQPDKVIVIGAGMGGLSAAIRLAALGCAVTVVEMAEAPGGKARALPSSAGPVDTGPTVLTMRAVFDALFALGGTRLDDHIRLIPQPILARHWWRDGSTLDLFHEADATVEAIRSFAGPREAEGFVRFDRLAKGLYQAFEQPVMLSPRPDTRAITRIAAARPQLWPALMPGVTLEGLLRQYFRDPRLVQLFARYATYVGGRPGKSPGELALIWQAEAAGVWAVEGGMHSLARALAQVAETMGVRFRYATRARRILRQGGHVTGVEIEGGATLPCRYCVFNGDPGALTQGFLGDAAAAALLRRELTLPDVSQTVILTRTAMKASAMSNAEDLDTFGKSGATLAIHLSVRNLKHVCETLIPHYGAECPVAVVYRASWPDQQVVEGTLTDIRQKVRAAKITRTALILVGRVLAPDGFTDSALYDADHVHVLRPRRKG